MGSGGWAGEVGEWTQGGSGLDAFREVVEQGDVGFARRVEPLTAVVVLGVLYAVEKHAADAVGEHGCEGLAERGAVGSAPESELAVFVEGVDDAEEVAGCERCAEISPGFFLALVAGVGEPASVLPCFGLKQAPEISLGESGVEISTRQLCAV